MKTRKSYFTHLSSIVLLGSLLACTSNLSIKGINLSIKNEDPTRVFMALELAQAANAYVEYWSEGSSIKMYSPLSANTLHPTITLLGLKSETKYNYRVHLQNDRATLAGEVYSFTTQALPNHLPAFELVKTNTEVFKGFIMLRKMDDPGTQIIINNMGDVVWYQQSDSAVFRPFWITSDTSYIALKSTEEIVEMSIRGDTLLHLKHNSNGFDRNLHHEIFKDQNQNIIALSKEIKTFDLRAFGGSKEDTVLGDGILILNSKGEKIWSWSIFNAMDVTPSASLYDGRKDWSHANALSKDVDGNFLISFRNFSQIWKISAADGHIIWQLGKDGTITLDKKYYFKAQHAVHVNPAGNVMLFDNLGKSRNTSRVLAFDIDTLNNLAKPTLVINLPDSLSSFKQGNVNFIADDKLLYCSSMSNKIAVVNTAGEILWQVNSNQSFYRAEFIGDSTYFYSIFSAE